MNLPTTIEENYIRIFVDVVFKQFLENQIEAGFQEFLVRKPVCIHCDNYTECRTRPARLYLKPCKNFKEVTYVCTIS